MGERFFFFFQQEAVLKKNNYNSLITPQGYSIYFNYSDRIELYIYIFLYNGGIIETFTIALCTCPHLPGCGSTIVRTY